MKKTLTIPAAIGVLLWVANPPAAAQNREHQQMAAELRMLQEQQQQLSLALAQLVAQTTEALKAVNARIEEINKVAVKASADQQSSLNGMASDLSVIRERAQDSNNRIQALNDEVQALSKTMASLPSLLTQGASATPPDPLNPGATAPSPTAPVVPSTAGLSPQRMYDTAWADYGAGQYTLAITGFEQLLRTFPTTERADDAQFYIGEALSQLFRWEDAIAAYNRVIQNYPMGDQIAMAYYKRGIAQERTGQTDAARSSFEQVIKRYPDSDGGRLAKQGLDRLKLRPATRQ